MNFHVKSHYSEFFIRLLFIRIPRLRKAKLEELPRNHAQTHVQVDQRFFLSNYCSVFPPFFKYYEVFQDHLED